MDIPPAVAADRRDAGFGLRIAHLAEILGDGPTGGWLEIHSETFLANGGPRLAAVEAVRADHDLSCHSVGISLGSARGLDVDHLRRLRALYDRLQPWIVSDHLAWCVHGGAYLNDLLPLPYTDESLACVVRNVDQAQTVLGRRLLVENPSRYVGLDSCRIPEPAFLGELARRTGCGLLLDVNNVHVSAVNLGLDADAYLRTFPMAFVEEIHVAGHARREIGGRAMLIDDHGSRVSATVWDLLASTLARTGPRPVLVEWDNAIPDLATLRDEAARAQAMIDQCAATDGRLHVAA